MSTALFGSVCVVVGFWPLTAWAGPLTVNEVVRHALDHHPELRDAEGASDTALAARREVGFLLEDPEVQLGVAVLGDLIQGQLTQPLSLTGAGWSARQAARAHELAATATARRTRLVVAASARAAWVQVLAADERVRLAELALEQADRLRAAVEDRAAVGEAPPLDARLARLGRARWVESAIDAHRDLHRARVALVGFHPEGATAELTGTLEAAIPTSEATGPRSDVQAANAFHEAAKANLAFARASTLPPLGVGAMFQRDGGEWDVGPQIGLTIPIWARGREQVAAARADLALATASRDQRTALAAAEQLGTREASMYAERVVASLDELDEDAREALASVERAWTAGELDVAGAIRLRAEIVEGWQAGLDAREARAYARLDALLAHEADALLEVGP